MIVLTKKFSLDTPHNSGPIYATSLPANTDSRSLSLMTSKEKALNTNTNSLLSLGIGSPAKLSLQSHGPIHSSILGNRKAVLNKKGVFHMDRTPITLEGRFPPKSKRAYFDENNAEEEQLFQMYDIKAGDFKDAK